MKNSPFKNKDKYAKYQTNIFKDGKNYSIQILIKDGKLQILVTKDLTYEIIEFSNSYSLKQLQITNKYFSTFSTLEKISAELDKLMKQKVNIEEEEKDKIIILRIPTSIDKHSGEIVFKILKIKKARKVSSKEKFYNKNLINDEKVNDKNTSMLLGNINELKARIKKLEKNEEEKDKKFNELKDEMTGYQEKINDTISKSGINVNLIDDQNKNISQIIKNRNEAEDEDIDINLETDRGNKNDKKIELINNRDKKKDSNSDDSENSSESGKKKKKRRKNSSDEENNKKNDSDNNKAYTQNQNLEASLSGFPKIKREETLKEYINSRIFYTLYEMQMVKFRIANGKKNIHPYFDLLYRATVDGDYEEKIMKFSEGHYPQIILFLTKEGARFGVYIDKEKNTSFFKKGVTYKEKPGTSFLFSLNNKKFFNIKPGEIATDNRPEKLCFGRTYYYNDNESNWLIYIPRDEFLGVNCKFGNKESSFGEIKSSDIVGAISSYHLSDVEIFEVKFDNDDNDLDDNEDNDDNSKNIIMNNKKDKIEENDETVISDKKNNDEDEKEEKKLEEKEKTKGKSKKRKKKKNYEINNENDDDSD